MFELIRTNPDLWKILSIPTIFALSIAFWNWALIYICFYPTHQIRIGGVNWQGFAHSRVEKFASFISDHILLQLSSLQQMVVVSEPEIIAGQIERILRPHLDEYIDEAMVKEKRIVWENLPFFIKNRVYTRCHRKLKMIIDNLVEDIGNDIIHLVDLKELLTRHFKANPKLLNRIILDPIKDTLRFLIQAAMLIALILGAIPALIMHFTPQSWLLPLSGLIIGFVSNVLVIKLIFDPVKQTGPLKWTGIFYQFRFEMSDSFSDLITSQVLTVFNIIDNIFNGPRQKRTKQLVRKHIHPIVDNTLLKTLTQITIGPRGVVDLKSLATEKIFSISTYPFEDRDFENDRVRVFKAHYKKRLDELENKALAQMIYPLFKDHLNWFYFVGAGSTSIAGCCIYFIIFKLI